jgi:hypothetical protein
MSETAYANEVEAGAAISPGAVELLPVVRAVPKSMLYADEKGTMFFEGVLQV